MNTFRIEKWLQLIEMLKGARAYGLVGKVVCWSFVGLMMEKRLTLPYEVTAFSALISLGLAFALPGLVRATQSLPSTGSGFLATDFRALYRSLRASPLLVLVMLQGIGMFVMARVCLVNLFQPILGSKNFDVTSYGIVMSAMTIFEAIGSARPQWIKKWLSDFNAVFLLTLGMGLAIALIPFFGKSLTVVALCLFSLAVGLSFPIQRQLLNDSIRESRFRATILSLESIIDRAVCAWIASLMGGFLAAGQLSLFLQLCFVATAVFMALLYWVGTKTRFLTGTV